jgi:uncharacterized radical SAM superfamily Fe-S cluster-containing enzyme
VSISLDIADAGLIKATTSRCPVCHAEVSARVERVAGGVVMKKRCPEHGPFEVPLSRDGSFYFDSRGSSSCGGKACGCAAPGAAPSADPMDALSTCVALIEIVDSCNLTCPTCYASSPHGIDDDVKHTPFDEFTSRVAGVLARKGSIDILQLSGGEPTIHPEFFRLLEWTLDQTNIGYVLINTNAVRLATDPAFLDRLGALRRARGKFELYVQFDGPQEAGQRELRGADLRGVRQRAIDAAGAAGIPSTLAMVVTPATLPHLGDTVRFGLSRPHCRGVSFQPMFTSGRVPAESATLPIAPPPTIAVGDVVVAVTAQSAGLLTPADFTPLPCGDPNCHTIGYLLRMPAGPVPLGRLFDLSQLQGFLKDRLDFRLEDLSKCGCESEPLGAILKSLELGPHTPFRLFIKPFMDAWTFDQDRIDRCCTHVIRRDGSLDSFCRYYLNGGAWA